ncbi:holo-ACP synthase [Bacillus solimangrovi]|uniref:Holo-[acyl-carrier-protein] synthase n=1 Tax=Bacillus solimangrovi TaxID=1305675 RepID=A0A1E5LG68_9BACI|nr:holo-ACP synthase [Bacillus solimangrovi]OEH93064.1 holo-ACP synthase [Bacillus solimangrovi]
MIKGIGLDIVEIERIKRMMEKEKFILRILTNREQEKFQKLQGHRRAEFLAGRFAAKEAFAKALGTGIGTELSFQDIEILNEKNGKPVLYHSGTANVHLSITHSHEYAAAQVIIE